MATNNGNGYPSKVELKLGQEAKLKILRPVKIGRNGKDPYFLYRVQDLDLSEERSFFATADIHTVIEEQKLGVGSEFLLKRIQNGRNGGSFELSILSKAAPGSEDPKSDNFREVMRQCIVDAIQLKKEIEGIDLTHEDLRSLSSCLFIARTKQY
jgi:hypothetical protein